MSAEIVNLRRARKAKVRAQAADQAAENRARHGRTLADRNGLESAKAKASAHLDGHRLTASTADVQAPGGKAPSGS